MSRIFDPDEIRLAADLAKFLNEQTLPAAWADYEEVQATFLCDGDPTGVKVRKDGAGTYVVAIETDE